MSHLFIYVKGKPRPQPRPRLGTRVVSTAKKDIEKYRLAVERACREELKEVGHDPKSPHQAYHVTLVFWFATKKLNLINRPHTQVPDADNLAKLWLDCGSNAGLWNDDREIAVLEVAKMWAKEAGAMMMVNVIDSRQTAPFEVMAEKKSDLGAESVESVD